QVKLLNDLIPMTMLRFDDFRHARDLASAGKIEDAKTFLLDTAGREGLNRIGDIASEMRKEENRLFFVRTLEADRSQTLAAVVPTAGSGLVVALAAISIFLVRKSARARDDAEQQLRDINLNLEAAVDERTSDLREANEEIQRFTYIVSHD